MEMEKTQDFKDRRSQIRLGRIVFDYLKPEITEKAPMISHSKRSRGRPRKDDKDKVKTVSMKLSPDIIERIKELPFGKGIGTKVKGLLKRFDQYRRREEKQLGVLIELLVKTNKTLLFIEKNYNKAHQIKANESEMRKLKKLSANTKIITKILSFSIDELEKLLTTKDFKTLYFLLNFKDISSEKNDEL